MTLVRTVCPRLSDLFSEYTSYCMCSNLVPTRTSRLFLHRLLFLTCLRAHNMYFTSHVPGWRVHWATRCILFESFSQVTTYIILCIYTTCVLIHRPVPIPSVIWFSMHLFLFWFVYTSGVHHTVCASIRRRVPSPRARLKDDHVRIVLHIVTLATSVRFGLRWSQYMLSLDLVCGNKLMCTTLALKAIAALLVDVNSSGFCEDHWRHFLVIQCDSVWVFVEIWTIWWFANNLMLSIEYHMDICEF